MADYENGIFIIEERSYPSDVSVWFAEDEADFIGRVSETDHPDQPDDYDNFDEWVAFNARDLKTQILLSPEEAIDYCKNGGVGAGKLRDLLKDYGFIDDETEKCDLHEVAEWLGDRITDADGEPVGSEEVIRGMLDVAFKRETEARDLDAGRYLQSIGCEENRLWATIDNERGRYDCDEAAEAAEVACLTVAKALEAIWGKQ